MIDMATEYDILATKGDRLSLRLTVLDANGSALNLSGYTTSGFVRYSYGSTVILLDLVPVIHNSYVSGYIDVAIAESGITGLPITEAVYDIKIYDASGYGSGVFQGHFNIYPAATV